jgi:hypothetical protein
LQQLASILHQALAAVLSSELVPKTHIKREIIDEKESDVAYSQIRLNLPADHHHFGYITKLTKRNTGGEQLEGREEGSVGRLITMYIHTYPELNSFGNEPLGADPDCGAAVRLQKNVSVVEVASRVVPCDDGLVHAFSQKCDVWLRRVDGDLFPEKNYCNMVINSTHPGRSQRKESKQAIFFYQ